MEYLYWILLAGVVIAVMIIPQRKQQKRAQQIRDSLRTGMKIRTAGGFIGTIVSVKEDTVVIECSPDNLRLEILKGAVMPTEEETIKGPVKNEESMDSEEDKPALESSSSVENTESKEE